MKKTMKRLLAGALLLVCLSVLAVIYAGAESVSYSQGLQFTSNGDGTCYLSSIGSCTDTEIRIPPTNEEGETVTGIGSLAFYWCERLFSVYLPKSISVIHPYAFSSVYGGALTEIHFPEDSELKCIGDAAFSDCIRLESITLPAGVTSIGYRAFDSCERLKSVVLSTELTSIGEHAFIGCSQLNSIFIPSSVVSIGQCAFSSCTGLDTIIVEEDNPVYHSMEHCLIHTESGTLLKAGRMGRIPNDGSIKSIGDDAFASNSKIEHLDIPPSVTSIGAGAFWGCQFTSVTLPDGLKEIGERAFQRCKFTSISLPDSLADIGEGAFSGCHYLQTITIPCGISEIKEDTFRECSSLTSVILPDGLKSIGPRAFSYCGSLGKIEIPDSVTSIDRYAFSICKSLETITIPEGSQLISIGEYAFDECKKLKTVIFSEQSQLKIIGNSAFRNCEELTGMLIPESVEVIGEDAFYGCFNIHQEENGVKYVDRWVIGCDTTLTQVEIRENTKGLAGGAFQRCKFTSITLPESIISIGGHAFYCCGELSSITIPDGVIYIGSYAFESCVGLKRITVPQGITQIPAYAFHNCWNLQEVILPETISSIGTGAFASCKALMSIHIPDRVTSIGISAFYGCQNLSSIIIPKGITSIESSTFSSCYQLTSVLIPEGVKSIGQSAFSSCKNMKYIVIPASVASIGQDVFTNSNQMTDVFYLGTEDSWKTIAIGTRNEDLLNMRIHFLGNAEILEMSASCVAPGFVSYACDCGEIHELEIHALGHRVEDWDGTEATCIADGKRSGTCVICKEYLTELLPAKGHAWETVAAVAATCTSSGLTEGKECSACGELLVAQSEIPAYGHSETVDPVVLPKCTLSGLTEGIHCNRCGKIFIAQETIPSLGHTAVTDSAVAPTCLETGLTEGSHCSTCGEVFVGQTVIAALGHTEAKDPAVSSTCTETGLTKGTHCSTCGKVLERQQEIPALGHVRDEKGYCTRCGGIVYSEGLVFEPCDPRCDYCFTYGGKNFCVAGIGTCQDEIIHIPPTDPYGRPVVAINHRAFQDVSFITAVTIPDTVREIGQNAFSGCEHLQSVTLPEGILSIGDSAFWHCKELTSVNLPDSLTTIGRYAFYYCVSLTSVNLPEGLTTIDDSAFEYCESLTSIRLPESVTYIGRFAFYGTQVIEEENGIGYIGNWAVWADPDATLLDIREGTVGIQFSAGSEVRQVIVPDSVEYIGYLSFFGCQYLSQGKGDKYIGKWLYKVDQDDENVYIRTDTVGIMERAFINCHKLTSITIPPSVRKIDEGAFENCSNLQKVILPEGLTSIPANCFARCSSLTDVYIPNSVTSIGKNAFYNCVSLTEIVFPDSVTHIGSHVFSQCESLATFRIPKGVTDISDSMFVACRSLTSVVIHDQVTSIGKCAFKGCSSLKSITIPEKMRSIGYRAFEDCVALEEIYYNAISLEAPMACSWIFLRAGSRGDGIRVTVGKKVESIPACFFSTCRMSDEVATNLVRVEFESGSVCESIEGGAFLNCVALTHVSLPDSITYIGDAAFCSCTRLEGIIIPGSVTHIGTSAFSSCDAFRNDVYVSEGVTCLSVHMFYHCSQMVSVYIPASVTRIEKEAFGSCDSLTDIYYGGTEEQWKAIYKEYYNDYSWWRQLTVHYLGHAEITENTSAGCTEEGRITYKCDCGQTHSFPTAALGHDYRVTVISPTCETGGRTVRTCVRCGSESIRDIEDPLRHAYQTVVTRPTCETAGYVTHTCHRCGFVKTEEGERAYGHACSSVVTDPTCEEDGYVTVTCVICHAEWKEAGRPAVGHHYDEVITPPTCKEDGYVTRTCTRCSHELVGSGEKALGHDVNGYDHNDTHHWRGCKYCGERGEGSVEESHVLRWTVEASSAEDDNALICELLHLCECGYGEEGEARLIGASFVLGPTPTLRYYAIFPEDLDGVFMRFTYREESCEVEGVRDEASCEYVFSFDRIAIMSPDVTVKAELIYRDSNGTETLLAVKESYGVSQYCVDAKETYPEDQPLSDLLDSILALIEVAKSYNDSCPNGITPDAFDIDLTRWKSTEGIDFTLSESGRQDVFFTATGLSLGQSNRLYYKFTAADTIDLTVAVGDRVYAPTEFLPVEGAENTYMVYSDGISTTAIGKKVTATLTVNGESAQSITYSVAAYVTVKQASASEEQKNLLQALCVCGQMAAAYLNHL